MRKSGAGRRREDSEEVVVEVEVVVVVAMVGAGKVEVEVELVMAMAMALDDEMRSDYGVVGGVAAATTSLVMACLDALGSCFELLQSQLHQL